VFEVRDGRITVWRDYFDVATATRIHEASDS
jgi:limonene-1,2-epoxide hydrolase